MSGEIGRRTALLSLGTVAVGMASASAARERTDNPTEAAASGIRELSERLRKTPRRRDFKTVPMILDHPDLWDSKAIAHVIGYRGVRRQVWDNTSIASAWLNLMRHSLNAQVYSFKHPDFLAVSATHGTAHLALFDQPTWDKYQLSKLAGDKFKSNTLMVPKNIDAKPADFQHPDSIFGSAGDSVAEPGRRISRMPQCDLGADGKDSQARDQPGPQIAPGSGRRAYQSSRRRRRAHARHRGNDSRAAACRLRLRGIVRRSRRWLAGWIARARVGHTTLRISMKFSNPQPPRLGKGKNMNERAA